MAEFAINACEHCRERRAKYQNCNGDGRLHRHGRVHTLNHGLLYLCDTCWGFDKEAWETRRKRNAEKWVSAAGTPPPVPKGLTDLLKF